MNSNTPDYDKFYNLIKNNKGSNDIFSCISCRHLKEGKKIYNQMKNIYIIRIKAWEKLIENS